MKSGSAPKDAASLMEWLMDKSVNGAAPLSTAENLAQEYLIDESYADDGARIDALIQWETTKNFTAGFITGLGGILTMPVSVPADMLASWLIQARMSAAIARICGFDLGSDRVQTFILASLAGDAVKDVGKAAGLDLTQGVTKAMMNKLSAEVVAEVQAQVGKRLMAAAAKKGAASLARGIPLLGGVVGGVFDATACNVVGRTAKALFYPRRKRRTA
ncbi:EcsC family protein [Roseimicrobium gellanilyticum]|uniref:EcsC family protein n=1 Tax=Roseimicrobium gellanilyticum TaxID=748857 RepID=A0A366HKU7_9BACT|nr:EcsC family protein [Roseimicrobium gellanilyticum]RBP42383.1 EcsC family protein [Roseimicrobium gellanilyticum]